MRCFEFTNRGDQAHLVFGELVRRFYDDERVILGAGSVIDPGTAAQYIQLGANFIVGPVLEPGGGEACATAARWPTPPAAAACSEISAAEELGVEIVKIFPGSQVGGPGLSRLCAARCPGPTSCPPAASSPTEENMRAWFEAGVACVGMGSKLVRKDLVAAGDFEAITRGCRAEPWRWIQDIRAEHPIDLLDFAPIGKLELQ